MFEASFKALTLSHPSFDGSFELISGQTSMVETTEALYFWLGEQAEQIRATRGGVVLTPCDMYVGYTYSLLIGQDGKPKVADVRKGGRWGLGLNDT